MSHYCYFLKKMTLSYITTKLRELILWPHNPQTQFKFHKLSLYCVFTAKESTRILWVKIHLWIKCYISLSFLFILFQSNSFLVFSGLNLYIFETYKVIILLSSPQVDITHVFSTFGPEYTFLVGRSHKWCCVLLRV